MKRDNPSSQVPDTPKVRIIEPAPPKAQQIPAWPAAETDPQFDPGTSRPVETSDKANDNYNPTNNKTEESVASPVVSLDTNPVIDATVSEDSALLPTLDPGVQQEAPQVDAPATQDDEWESITTAKQSVATPAADLDTTPVVDATMTENSAPLPPFDAEIHQGEPQAGAQTAQDDDQEGTITVMPNVNLAADLGTPPVIDVTVSEDSTPLTTHDAEGYREEPQAGAQTAQDDEQEGTIPVMPTTAPAADLDTTQDEYATMTEYLAPLTTHEEEDQREEPQVSAPATQDDDQEITHTEPAINNDAGVDSTAEKKIADAEVIPAAAPEGDNPQNTVEPDSAKKKVAESEVVKEAVKQTLPTKTLQEQGQWWVSLFRVLTEDGPAVIKNRALAQFTSGLDEFKKSMLGKTLEQRAKIVSATVGIINPLMMKADAFQCLCAIMIGELANNLKKDVPHGDWTDMSRKYFPQIEPRDLQQCMRLANVRQAARYCHLGKTKLSHLAAIASKSPFNSEDDPIGKVLIDVQGHQHILPEEYERLSLAAISNSNLKKLGLFIDQHVLRDIYEYGEEITDKDIAEMLAWKERHENGESELTPTDFLSATLKNDGKRVFELTDPNEKKGNGKGKPKTPTIPEINSTFEKTRETVQLALENLDPSKLKVDRELYHTLMTTLKTFGETVFPS